MRIAVVNNFFPPRVGGSAHLAESLAEKFVERGHEVIVLTAAYRDAPAEEQVNGYRVYRLPAFKMPKLGLSIDFDITFTARPSNLRRVFRLLDEFQPDVIHQHGQFLDLSWLTGWYSRRRRVPALLSVHTRLESTLRLYSILFRLLDRFLVRPILRLYKPRFVIMDEMAERYCAQRYGATEREFDHIPVAVDPREITALPTFDVRDRYGLCAAPLIVSLGHVIPLRNRLALVRAMPAVLERHPKVKVLVVGRIYYGRFLELARQLGVRDVFVATGPVAKDQVPSFLAEAAVVAHDLQGIGCGTASLEAMAAGKATVCAVRETNFPWVELRNWDNALLVRPDDPAGLAAMLNRLLDDPDERERIAARQRDVVLGDFTLDVVTDKHLAVFDMMTAPTPAGTR